MNFFIRQSSFSRRRWNTYSSSWKGQSGRTVRDPLRQRKDVKAGFEQKRLECWREGLRRMNCYKTIHVHLSHWICGRKITMCGQWSRGPCNTVLVVEMDTEFDGIAWLLPASKSHTELWRAFLIAWRGLSSAVWSYPFPVVKELPTWVLCNHDGKDGCVL